MQATLSNPIQPQAMSFGDFLSALFGALEGQGLHACVLRNYEGFPAKNVGGDIDLLIRPTELPRAFQALRFIQQVRVTGYTERPYVACFYLSGAVGTPDGRSLQVDFDLSLSWKGLPYLPSDGVLQRAMPRRAGELEFLVPSPVHEAVTSLLASLLVAGRVKEKYLPFVRGTFAGDPSAAIETLKAQFGEGTSKRLVEAVMGGDRRVILGCVRPLRASLLLRSLRARPLGSLRSIVRHYVTELKVRFLSGNVETVFILGPDQAGKERLIEDLLPILQASANEVHAEDRRFESRLGRRDITADGQGEIHARSQDAPPVSAPRALGRLLQERLVLLAGEKNLRLRIIDGDCCQALIRSGRNSSGDGGWLRGVAGMLAPSGALWILLDPGPGPDSERRPHEEKSQAGTEGARQDVEGYRSFVKTRKRYVVLHAGGSHTSLVEGAYAAIIDALAGRTDAKLRKRFRSRKSSH